MPAQRSLFCLKLPTTINASPYRARASRPSAPLRNGIFLLMAQPPLLEKEGNGPVSQPTPLQFSKASETGKALVLRSRRFRLCKARCKTSVAGIHSRASEKTGRHRIRTIRVGSDSVIVVHCFGGESECARESPCPACAALARRQNQSQFSSRREGPLG